MTPAYTDIQIRLGALQASGYPVELSSGSTIYPVGYLSPEVLPWHGGPSPAAAGDRLFGLLFADPELRASWAEARGQNPRRRIRLRIDAAAPELHDIPWELLREARDGAAPQSLAADAETPFARFLAVRQPERPPAERPLRVLVAVANPSNLSDFQLDQVDVAAEQQAAANALAGGPDAVQIDFLPQPVTLASLDERLGRGYHVLQIVAHGMAPADADPALFLADAGNHVALVSDSEFADLIERRGGTLRLVLMASCQTATRRASDAFSGFAPQLVRAGVPAVLAMQGRIPQTTARAFGSTFYQQLREHGQVDLAANEARSVLLSRGDELSWALPVLFSRVANGQILMPQPLPDRRSRWDKLRESRAARLLGALLTVLTVVATLVGLVGDLRPYCEPGGLLRPICKLPPPPMPERAFNIVVVWFSVRDEGGKIHPPSPESRLLGQQLFAALDADVRLRSGSYPANIRGPDIAESLAGRSQAELDAAAAAAAEQHNATILIYGFVAQRAEGQSLELRYFVRDPSFSFGSELAGAQRLGKPVPLSLPLDAASLNAANAPLKTRIDALQLIVVGLKDFANREFDEAVARFRGAAALPDWQDDEGKEVAHLLVGAALLRADTQLAPPAERLINLGQAKQAFVKARDLAPGYARSYLGLGSTALQQADASLRLNSADGRGAVPGLLNEARAAFEQALAQPEQPPRAYVPLKANYGLGQAHLLGATLGLPGWTLADALAAFETVLAGYKEAGAQGEGSRLVWFAGHTYAYKGEIAGRQGEWAQMSQACRRAIQLLDGIPLNPPKEYIAYYWTRVAFAEEQGRRLPEAVAAYEQALTTGKDVVPESDLQEWAKERDRIAQEIQP